MVVEFGKSCKIAAGSGYIPFVRVSVGGIHPEEMYPYRPRSLIPGTAALIACLALYPTSSHADYTFTTLKDPLAFPNTGGGTETFGGALNNSGQVVGTFIESNGSHGLLYSGGVYTTIDGPLGGPFLGIPQGPYGINNLGQVVGYYVNSSGSQFGYLYSGGSNGTYTTIEDPLDKPINPTLVSFTNAYGINDSGQIVGQFQDPSTLGYHGFLYSKGVYTTLDDPLGVNSMGNKYTFASAINNSGQIVGYYDDGPKSHGFLYANGVYTTLDDPLGVNGTLPLGINSAGQIVGNYLDASFNSHGFLYSNGIFTSMDLLGPSTTLGGINDSGQLTGTYDLGTSIFGFVATPSAVPEPSSLLMCGLGGAVVAAWAAARRFRSTGSR